MMGGDFYLSLSKNLNHSFFLWLKNGVVFLVYVTNIQHGHRSFHTLKVVFFYIKKHI